jgi:hypothetical protein
MPAATMEILERESKDVLSDVELFLDAECANTVSTPLGLEVSFGRPLEADAEPLARAEPVNIDLGAGLTFRIAGRIDRIDKVGASFEVLDYKTGGFWRDHWKSTFNGGRRLQHALYGLAAVALLRSKYTNPKVVAGVYYFSSHKGRQERLRIGAPQQAAIARVPGDPRAPKPRTRCDPFHAPTHYRSQSTSRGQRRRRRPSSSGGTVAGSPLSRCCELCCEEGGESESAPSYGRMATEAARLKRKNL